MRAQMLITALLLSLMLPVQELKATTMEHHCLALNIFHEANGHTEDMRAVGHVTINRVKSRQYPDTVCGVVYQRGQFSWTTQKSRKIPRGFDNAEEIAEDILSGNNEDPTSGATHFYDYRRVQPRWASRMEETLRTNVHSYRKPV